MYFNIGRIVYLQTDVIFPYVLLAPTIIACEITLGAMNQILNAFTQVRTSFQYLVNSWSTIVELISIYQRLRGFEAKIHGEPLPSIETWAEHDRCDNPAGSGVQPVTPGLARNRRSCHIALFGGFEGVPPLLHHLGV
jgi:ABC-type uncharacterized transport system fused permease/ATPase subunit